MNQKLEVISPPEDPQIEKYGRILGINSVWLLPSLGALLLFMGLYPLMLVFFLLLILFSLCCPSLIMKYRERARDIVFWNMPIKFLNDSYTIIVISCFINIKYASWETKEAVYNTGVACGLLAFVSLYPVFMQTFLYCRRDLLIEFDFRRKYGSAYEEFEETRNKFVLYPLFSYYRRILVPITIIFLPDTFIAQYLVLAICGVAITTLIW